MYIHRLNAILLDLKDNKKGEAIPVKTVEDHRVVRRRGSHIF
jgi:hypothetical protein